MTADQAHSEQMRQIGFRTLSRDVFFGESEWIRVSVFNYVRVCVRVCACVRPPSAQDACVTTSWMDAVTTLHELLVLCNLRLMTKILQMGAIKKKFAKRKHGRSDRFE